MLRKLSAACAASLALIASASSAQQLEPKVFLEAGDSIHFVSISREGTTCMMTFVNEIDQTGVSLLVGRTVATNHLSLYSTKDIGAHGDNFDLSRQTLNGIRESTTTFSKKSPQPGFYRYASSLNQLRFDFDDFRTTGGFLLNVAGTDGPSVFVGFNGTERDRAVAAMVECVESLPEYWSLDD